MIAIFLRPAVRPYLILVGVVVLLAAIDAGHGRFLTLATAYSALQSFSTFGLVALGLGLTMLIGEFDLSTAGVFGLAGCVALTTGAENAGIGLLCAVGVGGAFGFDSFPASGRVAGMDKTRLESQFRSGNHPAPAGNIELRRRSRRASPA